jgi:hypothetical protein
LYVLFCFWNFLFIKSIWYWTCCGRSHVSLFILEFPSTMERTVLNDRGMLLGHLIKNQGRLDEALSYFEKLFSTRTDQDHQINPGRQIVLFSGLADLYRKVGDLK